ncbi:MAG: hypothetical protein V1792_28295 [Pseudomonadota bacterium]
MSAEPKPTIEEPEEVLALDPEEPWEDYMDYCAAAEAIEDALKNPGKIKRTKDFAKDLGFEF